MKYLLPVSIVRFPAAEIESACDALGDFWCSICDEHLVRPNNPDTGRFFATQGHSLHRYPTTSVGRYIEVITAVCQGCLSKHTQVP